MNIPLFFFITFTAIAAAKISQLPTLQTSADLPALQSTREFLRCGFTLNTATGGVYYKAFEPILPKERCVWTIGAPKATGYKVTIEYLGKPTNQPGSGQGLLLFGIGISNATNGGPNHVPVTPTAVDTYMVPNSNILTVTFYSSSSSSNSTSGFALTWETQYNGTMPETAANSSHYLIDSPRTLEYPVRPRDKYSQNELSTFVFPPARNIYHRGSENHIYLRVIGLREKMFKCSDALHVYSFNANSPTWFTVHQVCNSTKKTFITRDDLTMIVLRAVEPPTHDEPPNGFAFTHTACSGE